jgi:2-hydroxychromene-2-carboxylate isomerase
MTATFDFYFSFRSPYSYLATPQVEELMGRYDLAPRMRIVLPIALRIPGFFKQVNPLWPPYLLRDTARNGQMTLPCKVVVHFQGTGAGLMTARAGFLFHE